MASGRSEASAELTANHTTTGNRPHFTFLPRPMPLPLPMPLMTVFPMGVQQKEGLRRPSSGRNGGAGPASSSSGAVMPVFKATNPSHVSCCAFCKTLTTSGCWRRGWLHPDGGDQHVNLCNKCGLRYKHGRLPDAPAAPPTAAPGPHQQASSRPAVATALVPASAPAFLSPLQLHHLYHLQQQRLHFIQWQQVQQARRLDPAGGSVSVDPAGGSALSVDPLHKLLTALPPILHEPSVPTSNPLPEHLKTPLLGSDEAANTGASISAAGGCSDEELPLKRPCSRTRQEAAMTLLRLNGDEAAPGFGFTAPGLIPATRVPSSGSCASSAGIVPPAPAGSSGSDAAAEHPRGTYLFGNHSPSSAARHGPEPAAACAGAAYGTLCPLAQLGTYPLQPAMIHPSAHFLPGVPPCGFFPAGLPPASGQCAGSYPSAAAYPYPFYPPWATFPYSPAIQDQFRVLPPAQASDRVRQGPLGGCPGQPAGPPMGGAQRQPDAPPCAAQDASRWTAARVQAWLGSIDAEDLCTVFQSQRVDGAALQSLYRAGAGGGDFLHALIREEFGPEARLVHRLRLLEGLQELFSPHPALEPNTSSSGEGGSQ